MIGKAEDKIQWAIWEMVSENMHWMQLAQHNIQLWVCSQIITTTIKNFLKHNTYRNILTEDLAATYFVNF
jgi:hypothetical protein